MSQFRLGIDFGYGYTGIALLDSKNKVLNYKVLKHRQDLSKTLMDRRTNRAQRRRKLSKIRRLRDFYALLKGMGIEPQNTNPGQIPTEREKASLGNRLYALAHYRGWDYASLLEMLVSNTEENKAPACPPIVKNVDRILIQEFNAPCEFNPKGRRKMKNESDTDYNNVQKHAKIEFDQRFKKTVNNFSFKTIPFIKIKQSCLGELFEKAKKIHELRKNLEKNGSLENEEQLAKKQDDYQILESKLRDANIDQIEKWVEVRINKVFISNETKDSEQLKRNKKEIIQRIMTMLGLQTGETLFQEGKSYRPNKNRHRKEMLHDLEILLQIACGLNSNDIQKYLEDTFKRLEKSQFNKKKQILSQKQIKEDWQKQIEVVNKKAEELAKKTNSSVKEIKNRWIKSSKKILNRDYRKKRFENRNSMGKCPAKLENNKRCSLNVPKKCKKNIRKLQFEIELRQMKVRRLTNKEENLSEKEIQELISQTIFERKPKNKNKNVQTINQFLTDKKGNRYVPPAKNEARGKKDILKDIVCGEQTGRANFCVNHLVERLKLLKEKETRSDNWQRLHEERIFNLEKDAPPSISQKVQKTVGLTKKMIKKQGISFNQIEHIGIETARFDISSIAQDEGKKLKKNPKKYQESARGNKSYLIEDQNSYCLFCGEALFSDSHIDHLFPKSKGGGNIALNKVVGHAVCNINKHQQTVYLNEKVLSYIKTNNPKKYNFIKQRLETNNKLPQDMLALPQHTMFGAKLLKGAFMKELKLNANKIQKIQSGNVKYLRKFWFPFMDKQKYTLRAKLPYRVNANEEYKLDLKKLKLNKELFTDNISLLNLNKGENWLILENERIKGIPTENELGINKFALRDDSSKKFILSIIEINQDKNKKPKEIYKTLKLINQKIEISLKDVFLKDKQMKKLIEESKVLIQLEFNKKNKEQGEEWIKVKNNNLIGTAELSFRDNTSYIPWCDLKIYKTHSSVNNKNILKSEKLKTKELLKVFKIKTQIAEKVLSVLVQPAKNDSIREFHHALDAVVLASKVNWETISRLNKDIRERNYREKIKMLEQAREENAPDFYDLKKNHRGDLLSPLKSSKWFVKDTQNKRKIKFSKIDTEPLKTRSNQILQKQPLEQIEKKNVENIKSIAIQKAMKKAFTEINQKDENEKNNYAEGTGEKQKISQAYFLSLNQNHILHPKNTRSVLCKVIGVGTKQLWIRKDNKTKGRHYFKRKWPWEKAQVIKYKDNKKDKKTETIRFTHKFYWKDKKKPSYERNEIDKKITKEYEIIKEFSAGDWVEIEAQQGKWQITKLGDSATVKNTEGTQKTSTYNKLDLISNQTE